MKRISQILVVSIYLWAFLPGTHFTAAATEEHFAGKFSEQGRITSISLKASKLMIDNNTFDISEYSTKVYSDSGKILKLKVLFSGLEIRYNVDAYRKSSVKEIMVMPTH
jgi:hypothetical protein